MTNHLFQTRQFGLLVSYGGVALVFLFDEISVAGFQLKDPALELLGAFVMGRLELLA